MTRSSKVLGVALILGAVAVPTVAQAESEATACYAQLSDLDEARSTLDDLEAAVAGAKADRAALKIREAELDAEIAAATGTERRGLVVERADVRAELDTIAELLPAIESQAKALRVEVDTAERAYIVCVEATLD